MKVAVRPVWSAIAPIQSSSRFATAASSNGTMPAIATSKMRPPPSRTPCAIANSSSSLANVPGTGVPSRLVCPSVREVVKPNAPACIASDASRCISATSSAVAASFLAPRSPMT